MGNRLGIDNGIYKKNISVIDTIINKARETKGLFYFCRDKRYTVYYKGREVLTIRQENDNSVAIKLRNEFSGKTDMAKNLNKKYKSELEKIEQEYKIKINRIYKKIKGKVYLDLILNIKSYSSRVFSYDNICRKIIKLITELLEEYYKGTEGRELPIQGAYCSKYKDLASLETEGGLWIFDMEYNDIPDEKEGSEIIDGRFDMIALKKERNKNKKYKLIFIELKCNKLAIKNEDSGIIKHIEDMDKYMNKYKTNKETRKNIEEQIKNCINKFYYLGKRTGKKEEIIEKFENEAKEKYDEYIDFDNPEYWLLFDMQEETIYRTINKIKTKKKVKYSITSIDEIDKLKLKNRKKEIKSLTEYTKQLQNTNAKFMLGNITKGKITELEWSI